MALGSADMHSQGPFLYRGRGVSLVPQVPLLPTETGLTSEGSDSKPGLT